MMMILFQSGNFMEIYSTTLQKKRNGTLDGRNGHGTLDYQQ